MALQEQEMSHAVSWKRGIVCVHAHMIVSRRLWEAFVNQGS